MRSRRRALFAAAVALGLVYTGTACMFDPRRDIDVTLDDGSLLGTTNDGVRSWRGIPYAAPPVGDLRWRPPEPPEPWAGVHDASQFGPSCLQREAAAHIVDTSEDCLFVNVFRADDDASDLPVMVWLHGGSLDSGSGDLPPEMVAGLIGHGVVVVSLNYRLGQLGFFAHPSLAAEARTRHQEPVANFGLLDQMAALRWVGRNIAAFGGDPANVTIFGISAGGASVNYLMTAPTARGLFQRAISGSGLGGEQPPTYDAAAAQGEDLIAGLGAPAADINDLRALDGNEVANLPTYLLRNEIPILDSVLPTSVSTAFATGQEAAVPMIVGTTTGELIDDNYTAFGIDPVAVRQQLTAGREAQVLSAYGSVEEIDRHFLNDVVFTQPAQQRALAHGSRSPTYLYRFNVVSDQVRQLFGGAVHGADYPYVFGYGKGDPTVPGSQDLADDISACWASFAAAGRPECADVQWPIANKGAFVEFTNDGPRVRTTDPWASRLELVTSIYRSNAA